ncbi:uncharacterized protein ARMOST_04525 [Armillaria ostoyae]|uniref:Uncharacterized protein n=1 Tax=Armillaria ostoyae TaxID=47428 RepID=A0A284QXL0_ARMOS|nr:uncharacterized protein ARMOST_04525 [Armillaria ostoyae]
MDSQSSTSSSKSTRHPLNPDSEHTPYDPYLAADLESHIFATAKGYLQASSGTGELEVPPRRLYNGMLERVLELTSADEKRMSHDRSHFLEFAARDDWTSSRTLKIGDSLDVMFALSWAAYIPEKGPATVLRPPTDISIAMLLGFSAIPPNSGLPSFLSQE